MRDVPSICALVRLCICAVLFSSPSVAHAEVIDRVLAVVNGRLITLSDVNAAYALGLVEAPESDDRTGAMLARLIDRELQLAEVDRFAPPEPSAVEVERELELVKSRFGSAKAFEEALARSGIDLPLLREMLRGNLRIRAYLDRRFGERSPQAVDEWLAALRRRADIVDLYQIDR
jgi:hypothetical protein